MKHIVSSRYRRLPSTSPLAQFLSQHDDERRIGFITRLDRSPVSSKIATFLAALAVNIIILLFIICVIMLSFLRDFVNMEPLSYYSKLLVWAIQNVTVTAAIIILLRSTSVPFFFGECRLRMLHGFRPSELIIRKSPPRISLDSFSQSRKSYTAELQQVEHQWRAAIRAVNPRLLYSTTSAMLSSDYWTLEYCAVLDALRRISAGEFNEEDFEFSVWKQASDSSWTSCELWKMHEIMSSQQEVVMFKGILAQSGKGDLLEIWENMRLFDKDAKQEITPQAYQSMVAKFAQSGLDYESVWIQISDRTGS